MEGVLTAEFAIMWAAVGRELRSRRPAWSRLKESAMNVISRSPRVLLMLSVLAGPVSGSVSAQQPQNPPEADVSTSVSAPPSSEAPQTTAGPEIRGFISARNGDRVQVTTADGTNTV